MTTDFNNRTKIMRGAKRKVEDWERINAILDTALICHVGFASQGYPVVIPTSHWREGNKFYWHGHSKAKNISATGGHQVCVTVTLLDGLVLARSAFNHSVNYRSVMMFGEAIEITDAQEKVRQFKRMVDKFSPGRWEQLRPVTDLEIKATGLMVLDLDEVSCKVRDDVAVDEPEDVDWPVWAGVLPIERSFGEWQTNPDSKGDYPFPNVPDQKPNGEV